MAKDTSTPDTTYQLTDFLDTVLTETSDNTDYVFCVLNEPPADNNPWPPISERAMLSRNRGNGGDSRAFYMSTMIAKKNEKGEYRNRQQDFHALNMIVLDDVGGKVDPNALQPTYIIESSEGNYQWGYVLTEPLTDKALASRLVRAIYETDLTDSGGKMFNKFVRIPAGINGKQQGSERNLYPVTLKELHDDVHYTVDELIEGFGVELPPEESVTDVGNTALPEEDYKKVNDPVVDWLRERKDIIGGGDGNFISIRCPWHEGHSDGNVTAGYSPIGAGNMADHRAFHCFHEHCADKKTHDFLTWVQEHGGPQAQVFDPVAPLVSRYVLLEYSSEVADTWSSADTTYPITSLAAFRAAHRQFLQGERGGKQYYGEMWLEHPDTVRCKGRVYDPCSGPIIEGDVATYFNTYRKPSHARVVGEPAEYLEHIEWLIPDASEREVFHDWVAQKVQQPDSRSYAMVMVADVMEGENGEVYGTGRSTVGDILAKVFQAGVAKVDLGDITGKGDSQAAYNDWADGTQLCIIEETKEEATSYRLDLAAYEGLKKVIDTRPIPGVRVKPKYGKIYETTLYANFLFFTNHTDALQLPEKDRRFCVIDNAKGRRSFEEYAALQRFLRTRNAIARLYWWYMQRDISAFNHIYPPMTPAKERMIRQAVGSLDEVWERGLQSLKGSLATQKQITQACVKQADDEDLALRVPAMVRARWRKLAEVAPKWKVVMEGKQVYPRIIRDHDSVRLSHQKGEIDNLREIISQNDAVFH